MIGTFFNLCRACPSSMPLDKLHSEYKSTYRWHEFSSAGPEVVRKPPMPNQFASSKDHFFSKSTEDEKHSEVINAPINEPPLPRRKKCPELAYRHHEFIIDSNADHTDSSRARSNGRNNTPSRQPRSKSEGPPLANGRCIIASDNNVVSDGKQITEKAGESSTGIFRKTISKLSTEYRLQFVWPTVRKVVGSSNNDDNKIVLEPPKKSQSMGAIKSSQTHTLAGIHKKRTTNEKEAAVHELEPLVVNDTVDAGTTHEKKDIQNEYRKNFKSAFYSEKEKFGFEQDASNKLDNKVIANGSQYDSAWYKEVIELRKKAGEYRSRGWVGENYKRDLFSKQQDLWKEVSRRSSLSALSLASSIKPITKEDKERENKIKSSPTKPSRRIPGSARLIDNRTVTDGNLFGRLKRDNIRHHLERTTGADAEEGALLPSPTREKLMPTLPRSKTGSPQRGSPQKTIGSRHGSPLKGSPQKSPKKITKVIRSQSVGPTVSNDPSGSPKKQPKPMSASITAATASSAAKTHNKKTPASTPTVGDHQPRATASLSSSNKKHSRSKSSTLPNSGRQKPSTLNIHHSVNNNNINNNTLNSSSSTPQPSSTTTSTAKKIPNQNTNKSTTDTSSSRKVQANKTIENKNIQNKQIKKNMRPTNFNGQLLTDNLPYGQRYSKKKALEMDENGAALIQPEVIEQIVKSPPEPTRVKSPEQIVIMRSPDPVFWTVPLDTGKTFTVTQNVRPEGQDTNIVRPHSEIKVTTPSEAPARLLPQEHPQSASAPPELMDDADSKSSSPAKMKASVKSSVINGNDDTLKTSQEKSSTYDRPVPGSTLRCLDDPGINSPPSSTNTTNNNPMTRSIINPAATEIVDKARDRFDRYWNPNDGPK